jgi:PHD/YefM family antitoxin component YafN of YafNO toxin-antitoxin module
MTTTTEHAQSLADFRDHAVETLDRVNRTGEPEAITINGEVRGVLLSPAAYDELAREAQLAGDVASIRRALAQCAAGQYQTVDEVSAELRSKFLAWKVAGENGAE